MDETQRRLLEEARREDEAATARRQAYEAVEKAERDADNRWRAELAQMAAEEAALPWWRRWF